MTVNPITPIFTNSPINHEKLCIEEKKLLDQIANITANALNDSEKNALIPLLSRIVS